MAENNKRTTKRFLISMIICSTVLFEFLLCQMVHAENTGTITVKAIVQKDENTRLPISEASFWLYQIGCEEEGQWKLCEEFADSQVNLNVTDPTQQKAASRKLADYASRNHIEGMIGTTNSEGNLAFNGVGRGLYLLVQDGSVKKNEAVYQSSPGMFAVPSEDSMENWQVTVEPKFENQSIPTSSPSPITTTPTAGNTDLQKTSNSVKTGDTTQIALWVLCLVFSTIALVSIRQKFCSRDCKEKQ